MRELITHFGIDWRLLIAQAVNFGVLIFLLTKFAYRPILALFRNRREVIAQGLRDAHDAGEHLRGVEEAGEKTLNEARGAALGIVEQAETAARKRKDEILREAAGKTDLIMADARRLIEQEKRKAGEAAMRDAEDLVRLGLARVLGRLPAAERDRQLVREALRELKTDQRP